MKQFLPFIFSSCVLLTLISQTKSSNEPPPIAQTEKTKFDGITLKSNNLRKISAFLGIPYAIPPIGDLRFKPPIPIQQWPTVYNATYDRNFCVQKRYSDNKMIGHEDCLYMSIFKPAYSAYKTKLPVLFFVHGGSFKSGSGNSAFTRPYKILDHDIIFISINYRLGSLGFLSTGDSSSSGNYGLLDQALALKWVKENIIYFGGDPEKITISGNSAGAVSITSHLFSPLTKELFHAVIAQSGTIFMPPLLDFNPLIMAKRLAKEMGCPEHSTLEMVECFKKIPAELLVQMGNNMEVKHIFQYPPRFVPVIDGYFLQANPEELLKNGSFHRVPIMTGINRDEGVIFYQIMFANELRGLPVDRMLSLFKFKIAQLLIQTPLDFNDVYVDNIISAIRKNFLQKVNLNDDLEKKRVFSSILTQSLFAAPVVKFLHYTSQLVPTYLYQFEYTGNSWFDYLKRIFYDDLGVTHGDELNYLFDGSWSDYKQSESDQMISKLFIELWTNFCQYHDPTPNGSPVKWNLYNVSKMNFLRIDVKPTMSDGFHKDQVSFFNKQLPKVMEEGNIVLNETSNNILSIVYVLLICISIFLCFCCLKVKQARRRRE